MAERRDPVLEQQPAAQLRRTITPERPIGDYQNLMAALAALPEETRGAAVAELAAFRAQAWAAALEDAAGALIGYAIHYAPARALEKAIGWARSAPHFARQRAHLPGWDPAEPGPWEKSNA